MQIPKMRLAVLLVISFGIYLFVVPPYATAHPGRTDANGGHTCRTNCPSWGLEYGEYHYHDGGSTETSDYTPDYVSPAPAAEPAPAAAEQEPVTTTSPTTITNETPTFDSSESKMATDKNDNNLQWLWWLPVLAYVGWIIMSVLSTSNKTTYKTYSPGAQTNANSQGLCPWCGGRLQLKNGKRGKFYGCSNYRTKGCRYTKNF